MKRNMEFLVVADLDLYVVMLGTADPTNEEWIEYLQWVERSGFVTHAHLVVTDGGAPTFGQRRFLADVMSGEIVRVGVVSDSETVRAVVAEMAALNSGIKLFASNRYNDVLEHLQIDRRHLTRIVDEILILRTRLRAA